MGGTDSEAAFASMLGHLQNALASEKFKNSFPPLVFHLSDGESRTDAMAVAEQIKQLATADGSTLIANAYIGTRTSLAYSQPADFPGYVDISEAGASEDNVRLFNMSSVMPPSIEANLKAGGIFPNLRPGSRLFFDVRTKEMLKNAIQTVSSIGSRMGR